jgi:cysteine-rich repeat protein
MSTVLRLCRWPLRAAVAASARRACTLAAVVASALALLAGNALATVPQTLLLEGVLTSAGGPAADGDYAMVVTLKGADSGKVLHTEGPLQIKVVGGRFHVELGADGKLLKGATETSAFFAESGIVGTVKIADEPEIGPFNVSSVLSAMRAETATSLQCSGCVSASHLGINYAASATKGGPALDLACTGCVSVSELKFDGDLDLGGNSLKASNGTFSGDLVAKTVTATSFLGDGSKLTGIAMPSGKCKDGEVVIGVGADGKLICASTAASLPADGLDEVSGGVLSTEFTDVFSAPNKGVKIPDNTGADAVSTITVPDIGTAKAISIQVDIANTDLASVSLVLLPPDDKGGGYVLCDPCGKTYEKALKTTYPTPSTPKSGDLSAWIGKNPKGTWNLKVKDVSFCIPQKPGNKDLCDVNGKSDGTIVDWSITIKTLSNKKAQVAGDLIVQGGISSTNGLLIGDAAAACGASLKGRMRFASPGGLEICNGSDWVAGKPRPIFWQGGCPSNGSTSWQYFCTAHTDYNTAGRYLTVSPTNSGASGSNETGRITAKIAGFYRISFHAWGSGSQHYWQLYKNAKLASEGRNYNSGNSNNSLQFERMLWLDKGDYINLRLYISSGTNWYGSVADTGKEKLSQSSWLRVEYEGHEWKDKGICGDAELDAGEECDDGNDKDDDSCSNVCKTNVPPVQAFSAVALNNQSPTLTMGTIPGKAGKQIVIYKIGICGDSAQSSGSNQFRVSGGGLNFTWHAGQNNPGSTHTLSPTVPKGAGHSLSTMQVSYTASVGSSLTVQWTYHNDWDGYRCTDTDELGNTYNDGTASSVRVWVMYGYK